MPLLKLEGTLFKMALLNIGLIYDYTYQ